jgi:hypothetical protein
MDNCSRVRDALEQKETDFAELSELVLFFQNT